ncbi:MAG: hypothetical protein ABR879_05120 [Methanomassiliicoccales archaeon]
MVRRMPLAQKIIVLAIVVLVVVTIIAVTFAPPPASSLAINTSAGLNAGDSLSYSVTGTFNGSAVFGVFNTSFEAGSAGFSSWTIWPAITNIRELDENLSGWLGLPARGLPVGVCQFMTPFGVKNVVYTFTCSFIGGGVGVTTIAYVGVDPNVAYGFIVNSPAFHLLLTLNQTNNTRVESGNTDSIPWHNTDAGVSLPHEGGGTLYPGVTQYEGFYLENGCHISFNITSDKGDVYAFTEGNIRSMAEGGPFAYDSDASRIGAANETGEALVPAGLFVVLMSSHGAAQGQYLYTLS